MRNRAIQKHQVGVTLIELLIVIVLIGLASTGVGMSLGALTRTELKSSCFRIMAASRFAYNRATVQSVTVRIVFDLDAHQMWIEQAHGKVLLENNSKKEKSKEGEQATDPWEVAKSKIEEPRVPQKPTSPFGPIVSSSGEPIARYQKVSIGPGIRILKIFSPHDPEPIERGKGAIYFFPSGQTEHVVVQLADAGRRVFSVEIHPLTGRGKVYTTAYEPKEVHDDADEEAASEVEDDG